MGVKKTTNVVCNFPRGQTLNRYYRMLRLFLHLLQWIYSKVLCLIYSSTPKTIPTMTTSILMESATSLANRIRNQKVTSVEVVRSYISRMQEVDEVLNCVVDTRFEDALAEAEKADEFIKSGVKTVEELETETPFLGVPFTVPDSVAVKGLLNTMGLYSRREIKSDADAGVVSLMKEGGAIPLACTNVSESCVSYETHNPVFGRTCNPYDTNRTVGGPFGGEACLIASSGSPIGIAPSVRLPSAFNGIFGHKPSAQTEAMGLMSRNANDLLPALKLLTKNSKIDLNLDEPVDVKKLKYYYIEDEGKNEEIRKAADYFKNSHKAFVEKVELKTLGKIVSGWRLRHQEAAGCKNEKINLGKELVKALFGKSHHTILFLLTGIMEKRHSEKVGLKENYSQAFAELQDLLKSDGVLIYLTHPTPAYLHNESLVRGHDLGYVAVIDALGLPATHCPAGLDSNGLPTGFQVIAAMNQDRLTIAVAREIDKAFGGWKPPPTHGTFTLKNTVFHNSLNEKVKTL